MSRHIIINIGMTITEALAVREMLSDRIDALEAIWEEEKSCAWPLEMAAARAGLEKFDAAIGGAFAGKESIQ